MSRYIDAEKLKVELRNHLIPTVLDRDYDEWERGVDAGLQQAIDIAESLQQEQPEVDLEKEIDRFWDSCIKHKNESGGNVIWSNKLEVRVLARHFYGLRNRALEEVARHVYESWMGGTMDDVRRDMVELGKVFNARKENKI